MQRKTRLDCLIILILTMYKKGDKVVIVSCEMNPQYVGKIGKVESVLGTDDNALIKVSHKGKMIPDYATADCLIKMEE